MSDFKVRSYFRLCAGTADTRFSYRALETMMTERGVAVAELGVMAFSNSRSERLNPVRKTLTV